MPPPCGGTRSDLGVSWRVLELPHHERRAALEPQSGANLAESPAQPRAIPLPAPHEHVAIRAPSVAVVAPVGERECAEVQRPARELGEVRERPGRRRLLEVLQYVVTDDEIETRGRAVILDPAALPAVAPAEVFAHLEPDVFGAREMLEEWPAQSSDAAAGIEDAADRQSRQIGECR